MKDLYDYISVNPSNGASTGSPIRDLMEFNFLISNMPLAKLTATLKLNRKLVKGCKEHRVRKLRGKLHEFKISIPMSIFVKHRGCYMQFTHIKKLYN